MNHYIFASLLAISVILLLKLSFVQKQNNFVVPAISFGPKGIRIPKLLLLKIGLINSNEMTLKFILKKDYLTFAIICFAGIVSELTDLGINNNFYESTLRFLNFIILVISIIKIIFGIDLIKSPSSKKTDSEITNEILELLSNARISINSWDDFSKNFQYFAHLLPIIENEEEIDYKDLVISLSNVNVKKDFRANAFKEIQKYVQLHTGLMPEIPLPRKRKK
ncbi:hypothetical protein V6Z05_19555 [Leptospira venezuelensis]|uniref:hypothetical protein n=1 Tax=Leptospira venezuelensis TaxID=1958811 RepID=UPI000A376EE3|nr:hypothetical protein [Leptospira venezuelensis]